MDRILTVPEPVADLPAVAVAANEWVALPEITADGCMSLNVLHEGRHGLVELGGAPLLAGEGRYILPPGFCGLCCDGPRWRGSFGQAGLALFSRRPLQAPERIYFQPFSQSLVWEIEGVAALAVRGTNLRVDGRSWEAEGPVFVAVGREGDGAGCAAVDLARRGARALGAAEREEEARLRAASGLGEGELAEIAFRNLLFCHRFAAGRAIDTGQWCLVTSRSPRYYVAAAHWSRDSLLWALPGIRAIDPERARLWVEVALRRYGRHPGEHALYLDGEVLYPGFELDQAAALALAARSAGLAGPDLREHRDPRTGLYRTFLLPSDDPAQMPFVTYDNVLVWAATGDAALAESIRRHCIVPGPFGPQLAWAVDGAGGHLLYDEPPGSLELLAHYGFCRPDDPVYRNTVAWIHSEHNPDHIPDSPFGDVGCPHAPYPWVLSIANGLLAGRGLPVAWPEMDGGLACESVDPATGRAKTGPGFATAAGFLGYALLRHLRGA
jgi:hypothetical protein